MDRRLLNLFLAALLAFPVTPLATANVETRQIVSNQPSSLSDVTMKISNFLERSNRRNRMIQLLKVKRSVFSLNRDDYISSIQFLEKEWAHSPQNAMILVSQLQLQWQLLYLKEFAQQLDSNTEKMSRVGLIFGLATLTGLLLKQPDKVSKYLRLFTYLSPLLGQKGGELASRTMQTKMRNTIPPSPAEILQGSRAHKMDDRELALIIDELTSTSMALGGSAAVSQLKTVQNLARTGIGSTSKIGRFAKQVLIFSALFYLIEKSATYAIGEVRLSNLVNDEISGLSILRDTLKKSAQQIRPSTPFHLKAFLTRTRDITQYFQSKPLLIYKEYLQALSDEQNKLSNISASPSQKELDKKYADKLHQSLNGQCNNQWLKHKLLIAEQEGTINSSTQKAYDSNYPGKDLLLRKIHFLNQNDLAQNPPSIFSRSWKNYSTYYEKEFAQAMSQQNLKFKYQETLQNQLEDLELAWMNGYSNNNLCHHSLLFLTQTELFLRSLNTNETTQAADQIKAEAQLLDLAI